MPVVKIDYEKEKFTQEQVRKICSEIQKVCAEATGYGLDEISVFAASYDITVNAAPIEIYIYATFAEATSEDLQSMLDTCAEKLIPFKKQHNITVPFNLSIVKMDWKFKLGV